MPLTWGVRDHRFCSLFMKQQVMEPRMVAPMARASPAPTSRGTNRVSRAGRERMAVFSLGCHCPPPTCQYLLGQAVHTTSSRSHTAFPHLLPARSALKPAPTTRTPGQPGTEGLKAGLSDFPCEAKRKRKRNQRDH